MPTTRSIARAAQRLDARRIRALEPDDAPDADAATPTPDAVPEDVFHGSRGRGSLLDRGRPLSDARARTSAARAAELPRPGRRDVGHDFDARRRSSLIMRRHRDRALEFASEAGGSPSNRMARDGDRWPRRSPALEHDAVCRGG
jgi:hypothetical protein